MLFNDGNVVGEVEVCGFWIVGLYYGGCDEFKFDFGWLCIGDVGCIDE